MITEFILSPLEKILSFYAYMRMFSNRRVWNNISLQKL